MNAFEKLLALPPVEKKRLGVEYTPPEIAQQPEVWLKTCGALCAAGQPIRGFLKKAGLTGGTEATVILSGAGTSEFIGNAISFALRRELGREVISIPTTHLVTHAPSIFVRGHRYVLVSFARSGNSPESIATFDLARKTCPGLRQVAITCNRAGALARAARADANALCIELPPETNDKSLAMTSSFSSMALAGCGLAFMDRMDALEEIAGRLGEAVRRVIREYGEQLHAFAFRPFRRASFLGSNTLYGTMQECHLKMQEMTNGRVACRYDTFLGLRHGPQVFVDDECAVVAALSAACYPRLYEIDMLKELRAKRQGCGTLIICDRADSALRRLGDTVVELFPAGKPVHDDFRVMTDVVVGQILAVFKSMALGLKPDNPSPGGTINRVVKGVRIHRFPA